MSSFSVYETAENNSVIVWRVLAQIAEVLTFLEVCKMTWRVKQWTFNHPLDFGSLRHVRVFVFPPAWEVLHSFQCCCCWQTSWTCRTFTGRLSHSFFLSDLHLTKHIHYIIYTINSSMWSKNTYLYCLCLLANLYYICKGDVLTMDIMMARPSRPFMKQWKWTEPLAVQASWPASMTRWRWSLQTILICSTLEATPCGETQYLVCFTPGPWPLLSLPLSLSLYIICFYF